MKKLLLPFLSLIAVNAFAQLDQSMAPFYHGVASGDATADKVIIWTRVTPDTGVYSYNVDWEVATDNAFNDIVDSGTLSTDTSKDFTVKVDVSGLDADSWYYYRFETGGNTSIIGRTRTMPSGQKDELRFAVSSCSNLNSGQFYHSYNHMSQQNIDAVLHLGDYIYEGNGGSSGTGIDILPNYEILALDDYRQRYASYRLDSNLRKVHQNWPWYTVWDDHESANDAWYGGAENHDTIEGDWFARKAAANQAYFEWLPLRDNPTPNDYHIYRSFSLGSLGELIMLDTRLEGRSQQVAATSAAIDDPQRSILGNTQKQWFKDELSQASGKWKIVGQQVMFAPLEIFGGNIANADQWDGYRADRTEVINHVMDNNIENVVVLTGDIHTSWANDVPIPGANYNPTTGAGSALVEFVVSGITSAGANFPGGPSIVQTLNPHMKYIDLTLRGYLILTITDDKVDSKWMHVSGIDQPTYTPVAGEHWMVLDGERFLRPYSDVGVKPFITIANTGWITSAFPNPTTGELTITLDYKEDYPLMLEIYDLNGRILTSRALNKNDKALEFDISGAAPGTYFIKVTDGKRFDGKLIVKQ